MEQNNLATIIASMLKQFPYVQSGRHLNNTNFIVKKKVFAFVKKDSLVIKLPEGTVQKLRAQNYAQQFVMGKRVMKEWIVIHHDTVLDYKNDFDLLKEAIEYTKRMNERG